MSTIGSVPETARDESLNDTDESDDTYSCIMMGEDAGGLLCSLTGMLKIHLFVNCLLAVQMCKSLGLVLNRL